jgi:hypothetical protein
MRYDTSKNRSWVIVRFGSSVFKGCKNYKKKINFSQAKLKKNKILQNEIQEGSLS